MPPRGRPRGFDRQQALQKAMAVFWARGYDNASVAELGAAMGIAAPSLYAAFGDKQSLFREAASLYGQQEGSRLWGTLARSAGAKRSIEDFLTHSARLFTRDGLPRGCMIAMGALHTGDEAVREDLRARRQMNLRQLHACLRRGVEAGELPAGTDLTGLARFFLTVQEGMSIQARDGATRAQLLKVRAIAMTAWPG